MQVLETGSQRQGDEPEVEPWLGDPVISCYYIKNPISGKSGEGNGDPLQCSCLENPRDGGACGRPSLGSHRLGHGPRGSAAAAGKRAQPGPAEMSVPFRPLLLTAPIPLLPPAER